MRMVTANSRAKLITTFCREAGDMEEKWEQMTMFV